MISIQLSINIKTQNQNKVGLDNTKINQSIKYRIYGAHISHDGEDYSQCSQYAMLNSLLFGMLGRNELAS